MQLWINRPVDPEARARLEPHQLRSAPRLPRVCWRYRYPTASKRRRSVRRWDLQATIWATSQLVDEWLGCDRPGVGPQESCRNPRVGTSGEARRSCAALHCAAYRREDSWRRWPATQRATRSHSVEVAAPGNECNACGPDGRSSWRKPCNPVGTASFRPPCG